jgi:hypothetical protein
MKFQFAKLFFAVSVLGFTAVSFAQPPESTVGPEPVYNYGNNFLNSIHGWHVNGGTFINRFSSNGTDYAASIVGTPLTGNEVETLYPVGTRNHWGWNAGVGYYLDCADMDFNFDYYTIDATDSNSVTGNGLFPIILNEGDVPSTSVNGQIAYSYSTSALTVGHQLRPSQFFTLFYYGGVRYAHFSKNLTTSGNGGASGKLANLGSSFNGWGPALGINADTYPFYYFLPYLSFSGGIQTSFLYGNSKSYARALTDTDGDFSRVLIHYPTNRIVAPVFTGSLAVNYLFLMNGWGLKTTVGYQDTVLFGVGRSSALLFDETNSSFQGFYLNFTLRF